MAVQDSKISLITFNCRSFNDRRIDYIKRLFHCCTFLLLQEHCIYASMFDKLNSIDKNVSFCAVSPMIEGELLVGRPHGGCAIIWNSNIKYKITKVVCSSPRLCAIDVVLDQNINILICNVYMPCDDRSVAKNLEIYNDVLNEVSQLRIKYNPSYFIVGGDFNTDLGPVSQSI